MKYFFLTYGDMGLMVLNGLCNENLKPDLVITHKNYNLEVNPGYYSQLRDLCSSHNIELIKTDSIEKYSDLLKNYYFGFCVGFMKILKPAVFNSPKLGIYNLHCGKLPEFRGRAPISRALMNGCNFVTVTLHKINSGVDSGEIYLEENVPVEDMDYSYKIYLSCTLAALNIIQKAIFDLQSCFDNNFSPVLTEQSVTDKKPNRAISETERKINWLDSAATIRNKVRALSDPYPNSFFEYNGTKFFINYYAGISNDFNTASPGEIVFIMNTMIKVKCGTGCISIFGIKFESKSIDNLNDFFKLGDILK